MFRGCSTAFLPSLNVLAMCCGAESVLSSGPGLRPDSSVASDSQAEQSIGNELDTFNVALNKQLQMRIAHLDGTG